MCRRGPRCGSNRAHSNLIKRSLLDPCPRKRRPYHLDLRGISSIVVQPFGEETFLNQARSGRCFNCSASVSQMCQFVQPPKKPWWSRSKPFRLGDAIKNRSNGRYGSSKPCPNCPARHRATKAFSTLSVNVLLIQPFFSYLATCNLRRWQTSTRLKPSIWGSTPSRPQTLDPFYIPRLAPDASPTLQGWCAVVKS